MNTTHQPSADNPEQAEVFPGRIKLRRIDPKQRMRRFYLMTVQRDLFGGATLTREWGRIGSAGKVMHTHHADEGQAVDALATLAQQKFKRGYRI
ncbi:MAG: WGR domain-containing protein [Pacificibacter sp.]|uniref:WGR domain-containing protein n=1 Tax=Pacificibacter sp. TaxID=1917866 RepID=UPI00321BB45F